MTATRPRRPSLERAVQQARILVADHDPGVRTMLQREIGALGRRQSVDHALARHQLCLGAREAARTETGLAGLLVEVLDHFPLGVILLAEDGRVVLSNARAREILAREDGLVLREDGHLAASRGDQTARLRRLRASATAPGAGGSPRRGGVLSLSRPSGLEPLSLMIAPLRSAAESVGARVPAVAAFVSAPEDRVATAEGLLVRLYELTPAEAHVTALLLQGRSLEEVSRDLEITVSTVRTHLKRVLSKTGCHRQVELVRLLLSGVALLRTDSSI